MNRHLDETAIGAFTEEFQQSLPAILEALDVVDRDRSDRAAAHEAYRLIHALKGGASMVGLAWRSQGYAMAKDVQGFRNLPNAVTFYSGLTLEHTYFG